MLVTRLRLSTNEARASEFMRGRGEGPEDGVAKDTVLAGIIQPRLGGAILAHDATLERFRPSRAARGLELLLQT